MKKEKFVEYTPNYNIHPGEIIYDYLEYMSIGTPNLSNLTKLDLNVLEDIVYNKGNITEEVAEKLSVMGYSKEFWLNCQKSYDEFEKKER